MACHSNRSSPDAFDWPPMSGEFDVVDTLQRATTMCEMEATAMPSPYLSPRQ